MEEPKDRNKKMRKKIIILFLGILFFLALVAGIYVYSLVFKPVSIDEPAYIYIDRGMGYEQVVDELIQKDLIPSKDIFNILADRMNLPNMIKTGRYVVEDGMTMPEIIRRLRSGMQEPVNLTFNNCRTLADFAGRVSRQLMMDSVSLLSTLLEDGRAESFGFTVGSFPAMFIPNTYEVYWNIGYEDLLNRLKREYDAFWNSSRNKRAESIGLSPMQVSILASIVEEEASFVDEYPIVAGLYLNRLKRGMRLEADPTVKFALGDFTLRRILYRHLEIDSPYNTYRNSGLPPGPIRMPSIQAIEGVLSPHEHNYLFMCAKDDLSGRHNFATTHAEHARNAAAYQRALNEKGIFR